MSSNSPQQDYWGYLINKDRSPTALFEALLKGIAAYIVRDLIWSSTWIEHPLTRVCRTQLQRLRPEKV